MGTYGSLTAEILDDLDRDDLTAQAQTAIKLAITQYERRPWWFTEERTSSNTQDGQEYYALPSDFKGIYTLTIDVNGSVYPINERDLQYMDDHYIAAGSYKGIPDDFCIFDNQLRLGPVPDGQYTIAMKYHKSMAEMETAGASNAWTNECFDLIRFHADSTLALTKLQDTQRAAGFGVLEAKAFANAKGEHNSRVATGRTRGRR